MRTAIFFTLSLLWLTACQAPQPRETPPAARVAADEVQQLLAAAEAAASPEREKNQLAAVRLLLEQQQLELAGQLLATIPADLPPQLYATLIELQARLLVRRGEYAEAMNRLDDSGLLAIDSQLQADQQIRLARLRARVLGLNGDYLASAQQRIFIDSQLSGTEQRNNRDALWRALTNVPVNELQNFIPLAFSDDYRGWLELALIAKDNQDDLDTQIQRLDEWQQRRPNHPAADPLPGGLALLRELAANRPQRVALLLPLSGPLAPFGQAIRDGFVAAYYRARDRGSKVPVLRIYDSLQETDFMAVYQRAVTDGAELIIGPLDKQQLSSLFTRQTLPVTTLALNRLDDGLPPLGLFQFGLAPQDEARQAADLAFNDNRHRALVIAPDSEWGDRVSASFDARWNELGGKIVASTRFSGQEDLSSSIKNALLLQESESRARQLQSLLGQRLEFEPRRREDVDMVFLLARPQEARSIKPLLAFHYAGDIPVYSTSRIYEGYPQPEKDRDINGVRFVDMPWLLEQRDPLQELINDELEQNEAYQRMYALGVDSFQLYPRLRQLELIPNSRVYGRTGRLRLNERNEIEREMPAAVFRRGAPQLIPAVDQQLTDRGGDQDENLPQRRSASYYR